MRNNPRLDGERREFSPVERLALLSKAIQKGESSNPRMVVCVFHGCPKGYRAITESFLWRIDVPAIPLKCTKKRILDSSVKLCKVSSCTTEAERFSFLPLVKMRGDLA